MKYFLSLLSMLLLCLISAELAAQNELQVKTPNGNILLEVREEGVLIKKVTTAERTGFTLTTTDKGLLVYDTDLSAFFSWDGAQWVQIDGTDLVDDADADPTNELQDISLSGNQLSITNGSTVELTGLGVDTDDQTLSLTGSELSISEGNTVDLSNIDINLSGSDLAPLECNALAGKLTRNVLFRDVAASGNYAYLISGTSQDLKIVDISIPSAPTVTGTLPGMTVLPTSIAVNGNYAYVTRAGTEQDLAVIDISDPTAPALVGSTPNLGLYPNDVVVRDNYAYMASGGNGGFRVVDVSNPATPNIIGIVSGIGGSFLTISGDYAYLTDYVQSRFHIVNIANPAAPSLVSTTPLGYQPEAIAVRGSYVYINDVTNNELKIIDVSDPNAPNPIGSFPGGGTSSDIAVADDLAYYITYDPVSGGQYVGKLKILDLSDPANPSVLKTITDTPNGFRLPWRLAVTDQFAFVVDLNFSPGALFIFELCPQNIGFGLNPYTDEIVLTTPNYQDLSISGNTLSISNGNSVNLPGDNDNDPTNEIELPTGGSNGQVLTADGSNGVSWADLPAASILTDADNDTKIQVEKNADEDIIRFDVAGMQAVLISVDTLEGTIQTGNNSDFFYTNTPGWQSFTATVDASIQSIEIKYNTTGGYPTKSFSIYEGEGTGGNLLASLGSYTLNDGWNQIVLPIPVNMSSGAKYTIRFSSYAGVYLSTGNPYGGGRANHSPITDWSTRVNWVYYEGQLTTSSLAIENAYALPTTDGTNGQVLTTDGSGAASWSTPIGYQDLSLSGNTLSLTHDGTPVDLSSFLDSPWEETGGNVYRTNGNIGIGTTNPTRAKLEISGSVPFDPPGDIGYLNAAGQVGHYNPGSWPYSIYATNVISGQEFHAHSDERIKNILGVSDGRSDLNTLLQIEITDYRLRDTIAHGSRATKKVIAQQVEKVYPQAVSADLTEVVPDIYQRATAEGNWVMLATDLQVGERVKLITEKANSIYTVTAVEAGRFQVELPSDGSLSSTVFVYGREVNDFHTVDYEAISMLNVSATQEQQRLIEAQQKRIAELEVRVSELEALKADIQNIKAALSLPDTGAGSAAIIKEEETKK